MSGTDCLNSQLGRQRLPILDHISRGRCRCRPCIVMLLGRTDACSMVRMASRQQQGQAKHRVQGRLV